jgi:hypothetical protein
LLAQQVDQAFVLSQRTSTVVKHKTTRRHNEQRNVLGKENKKGFNVNDNEAEEM